jgi:ArsR family transcriptional regulator, arsenate/arsenite/antimonite-responsive transcriptional repressor / arsenate reductase (thioredoxin)
MGVDRNVRAARHAALGDPGRLAIVDQLAESDRSPSELQRSLDVASNLLAHHLDVLEEVGLIARFPSSGDRRRRYVRLQHHVLAGLITGPRLSPRPALFVCSANSARSQLAAVLWTELTSAPAASAGTHPAKRVHPGAVAAARRAGLDLADARPRDLADLADLPALVVTVCDRAHEELEVGDDWLHWSVPDPVPIGTKAAFDAALAYLRDRIETLVGP